MVNENINGNVESHMLPSEMPEKVELGKGRFDAFKSAMRKTAMGVLLVMSIVGCKSPTSMQKCLGESEGAEIASSIRSKEKKCKRAIEACGDHPNNNDVKEIAYTDCRAWHSAADNAWQLLEKKENVLIKERDFDRSKACKIARDKMNKEALEANDAALDISVR